MSSTILTNWEVYYADDAGTASTGHKQIKWEGGATGTNTLNELYSELMNLFDQATNNDADDSVPLKAVTPTLYEIGSFDAGDKEPWFIDPESVQHLTGGGLNTVGWDRVVGTDSGIVKMGYTAGGTAPSSTDVGLTISMDTDNDSGTILYVDTTNLEIWIRPDSNAAANSFDNTPNAGDTFSISTSSATGTQTAAATTGENIYANIYSIGSISDNTELYVTQNDALLTQWWDTGHIDILVLVSDQGTLIDLGLLRIFARQYSTLYDHFETIVATGGRNPIPLATADDINNDTGYRNMTFSGAADTYIAGEIITGGTSTAEGIVAEVYGSPTTSLDYYLIGDLTAFQAAEVINGATSGGNESSVALSDVGPNDTTPATITATFGGVQQDLSNGFGNAWYSVSIDCKGETISSVYERLKYITRRGHTDDIAADAQNNIKGEQYQGVGELYIPFDTGSVSDPFTKGNTVTVNETDFTGTITAKHNRAANQGFLIVRDYSGTVPVDGNTLNDGSHTASVDEDTGSDPVMSIAPNKQSPFGSFAGGKFFGARGVYLTNLDAADSNNYSLVDSEGNTQDPPSTVSTIITVKDLSTGSVIENAIVLVWVTNDDNYFYQASVSITGSGTTATVTHNSHGITTGEKVLIEGVGNDDDYNGVFTITVTDPNTYTYTAASTLGASPATGTITSTFVIISDNTNASGIVSDTRTLDADQLIAGRIRKSSASPYYKQGVISGIVSSTGGFTVTTQLVLDE